MMRNKPSGSEQGGVFSRAYFIAFFFFSVPVAILIFVILNLVSEPFEIKRYFINRRTGEQRVESIYFLRCYRSISNYAPSGGDLSLHGEINAPDHYIAAYEQVRRYFWSPVEFEDSPLLELPGMGVLLVYQELFEKPYYAKRRVERERKKLVIDFDELLRQRIAVWNSSEVDTRPGDIIERVRRENMALFGR